MDSILFIISLLSLVLVVGWYVGNEATNSSGAWGLLAIFSPKGADKAADGPRYKTADRAMPGRPESSVVEKAAAAAETGPRPRFAERGAGRFVNKDDSGYRIRGRLPMANDPPTGAPVDPRPGRD